MPELSPLIAACARIAVGVFLVVAAAAKLRGRSGTAFRDAILGYDLVPAAVAAALARTLPPLEAAIGVLLVGGVWPANVMAFALVAAFTAAVAISLARGRANHCGCIGFSAAQVVAVQWRLVYRNLVLLALLLADAAGVDTPLGLGDLLSLTPSPAAREVAFTVMAACLLGGTALVAALHGYRRAVSSAPRA